MRWCLGTAVLLLFAILAAGCRRAAPPAPDVAARVGETEVRYSEFEAYVERTVGEGETVLGSDVLSKLFDQFLDEELLARLAAERHGATGGIAGAGERRRALEKLLGQELAGPPDEAEIERYYRDHRQEFARPERVRLRQILTEDRPTAERALRELAAGADFADLARRISRDPSAPSGGEQGELARDDLPPAFAEVIFALQPGAVSRLVPAEYGFHIFQVTERLPAEVVPLAQARREIAAKLRRQRAGRRLRELTEEARGRYGVTVYERNLPFNYAGFYSDAYANQSS